MSGYSIFNRHANMDAETLSEIGDIISEVRFDAGFELTNQLYGLYDGYLYDELLINAENADLPKELFRRLIKVWNTCRTYPRLHYFSGGGDVDEGPEYDSAGFTEGDRMGVADAKLYLASLEQ